MKPVATSADYEWVLPNQSWRGNGEPYEGRKVELVPRADGSRVLRVAGSRIEQLSQWVPATPNALYAAQVKVRGKASPGTAYYLILSFLDENNRHTSFGRVDRVAVSDSAQEVELCAIARAPANVRWVGVGLHVRNQINDDFVEFSDASLRMKAD
jgi:hypothetical protein